MPKSRLFYLANMSFNAIRENFRIYSTLFFQYHIRDNTQLVTFEWFWLLTVLWWRLFVVGPMIFSVPLFILVLLCDVFRVILIVTLPYKGNHLWNRNLSRDMRCPTM